MPRPLRPDLHGTWHHVINRGADRQDIFSCDVDYHYFESLLADATEAHDVEVHAYALMTTHYHLLLHCPVGGLSAAMKDLQSVYVTTRHPTDKQANRIGTSGAGSIGALTDLDRTIASLCGVTVESMRQQHGRSSARLLAVTLATELQLTRSGDLAEHYGLRTAAAVRAAARRGRVRLADDRAFAALRDAALRRGTRNVTKGA